MGTVTDAEEFAGAFARHQPALLTFAVALGAGGAAEDVVQEAMLRAWKRRGDFPGGPPRAWLMAVTRNLVTDHHRSRARRENHEARLARDASPQADISGPVTDAVAVRAAVAALPRKHQDVIGAVYLRDLPLADAARALGVPHGTVRTRASRALAAMRAGVADD
jgi:RNA polymerase sigma factor (sigma-70 family)